MATKAAESTAVAKKDEKSTAVTNAPELNSMFEQDAYQGLENIKKEDTAIPFLRVLQSNSPELVEEDPKHVEGSKAGMFLNTVTKELYVGKEGVNVIPVHFEKVYLEWKPREDNGGGFVAQHTTREDGEQNMQEGNDLIDTANHYVLVQTEEGAWQPAVLSCKSTFMKASRGWNAMMQSVQLRGANGPFTPPSYACIYNVSTARQTNEKGSWYNISVERVGVVQDPEVYKMAKLFRSTLLSGDVKVNYSEDSFDTGAAAGGDDLPSF